MKDILKALIVLIITIVGIVVSVFCFAMILKHDFESDIKFLLGFIGVVAPVITLTFTLDILTTPTDEY